MLWRVAVVNNVFFLFKKCFQVLSNGILHSAKHRVTLNTKRSRYATIYFYGIDNAMTLIVPPELVTKDRPLKYRPFTVNEYRAYLVQSQVPMDGAKFLEVQPDATEPATESEQ
jgi:isopenicillin N synthase-like dioxygenase